MHLGCCRRGDSAVRPFAFLTPPLLLAPPFVAADAFFGCFTAFPDLRHGARCNHVQAVCVATCRHTLHVSGTAGRRVAAYLGLRAVRAGLLGVAGLLSASESSRPLPLHACQGAKAFTYSTGCRMSAVHSGQRRAA